MAANERILRVLLLYMILLKGVEGALTGVTFGGDESEYFVMDDSGCSSSCCADVTVDYGSAAVFKIIYDGVEIVNANFGPGQHSVKMECSSFTDGPGIYAVTLTVEYSGDSFSQNMMAVYETTLVGYTVVPTYYYAEPGTNITFDMEVDQGTNALFTVDLVTSIQLMKSCDGNTRTASYSQVFSTTGAHAVTTMVSNYGSKLTEVVVVNILYNLNGVTITADDTKPPGNGNPGIKVKMASGADTPMGNLTTWYTCSVAGSEQSLDLSGLIPGGEESVPCTCTGQGNMTVAVNITTEMSTLQEVFDIYCWDILNISITLDKEVQPINELIPFIIENPPTYGMQWSIDACQGFSVSNENPSNYDDTYANIPLDLSTATFSDVGNCTLHGTFWNEMYIVVLDLFFELDIGVSDLTAVPSATELLTGDTFSLVVNASGPGIFYAVDLEEAMVVQDGCAGLVAEHNFSAAGEYNIEVMASNRVNNMSVTVPIVVAYPINGYTVSVDTNLIQSTETVTFSVVLAASPDLPMGNLSVTISHCGTNESIDALPVAAGTTETFVCTYNVQGNYSVNVTIASSVDAESYGPFEISVCDNLATTISVSKIAWAVGEPVPFTLNNLPISGFQHDIDMGDGSTTHVDADPSTLLLPNAYVTVPDNTYTAPDDYNITFIGYNQCYSVTNTVGISVQYGIPNCTLEVDPTGTIVSPDHTVSFNFVTVSGTTAPNPSGVTCDYNFGEGTPVSAEAAAMDFSSTSTGYTLTHDYQTEGQMDYTFDCANLVSSVSFAASLQVYLVTAAAFTVSYPAVTALSEGSCTTFEITLDFYGLTYVPNNVQYTVDYGDGDGVSTDTAFTSYTVSKSICSRGDFTGELIMKYDSATNSHALNYALGTCNVLKTTAANNGLVGDTTFSFDVTNHLAGEGITVTIDWKDDNAPEDVSVGAGATVIVTHVFNNHGKKRPTYSSTNSAGSDTASLVEELYIVYEVADLELEIIEPVLLGVAVEPVIHYKGSVFLTNLTCEFLYDPLNNDRETLTVDMDTTRNYKIAVGFAYMDIKEETVLVTCSNPLSSQTLNVTFEVSSDCFEAPDIFESIHRRIDTPFIAYLHLLPTLTGSVKLTDKCKNTTEFKFEWTFKKHVAGTYDTFDDYAIETPNKISMNLATSNIEDGFYYVELYMYLVERPEDFLRGKQYMRILRPPLSCNIVGGDYNLIGQGEIIVLDAKTISYDPMVGVNMESGLDFSWKCYVVPDCTDTDPYLVPFSEDKSYQDKAECPLTLPTEGFIRVNTSALPFDQCYVFEQTISKDYRNSSDIQVVKVLEEKPCKVAIMCHKNCQQKITPEEPTSFEINRECEGATQEQLDGGSFLWTFEVYDSATTSFGAIAEWKSTREATDKLFELNPLALDAGASYKLTAYADAVNKTQGMAYLILVGNVKPRGSPCDLTPLAGTFLNVTFSVKCDNWLDEGIRNDQNDDLDKGEPLRLGVYQDGKLINTIDFTYKVTIAKLELGVGLEANDFMTSVSLRIADMFNGMVESTFDVQYKNSRPDLPAFGVAAASSDLTEEQQAEVKAQFTDFLNNMNETVALTESMGDPLQTANIISVFSSTLSSIEIKVVEASDIDLVTSDNVENEMSSTLEAGTTKDPYVEQIKEVKEVMAAALKDSIQEELALFSSSGETPPMSSITAFADALTASNSNPEFSTANSLLDAGESILALSRVIGAARNSTLSIAQAEAMKEAVSSALDSVISTNSFYGVPGVEVEGDEIFQNETTTSGGGYNLVEAEFLTTLLKRRDELRLKHAAPELLQNIANIIEATQNILLLAQSLITDNSTATIERESYVQRVEKASADDFINNPRAVNGSTLSVAAIEGLDRPNEIVAANQVVYTDNPIVVGKTAKLVEHPVTVAFMTKDGKKLKLKSSTIIQTDPIEAGYKRSTPVFIPGDAGKAFYHTFAYRSMDEQVCVTALPDDPRVCYDLCMRALIAPTEFEYDHCEQDITRFPLAEYCSKPGTCKRPGVCWISLRAYLCEDPESTVAERTARVKRSTDNSTNSASNTTVSDPLLTPYLFRVITLSCLNWDGGQEDWSTEQCEVSRDPVNSQTKCMCGDQENLITTVSFFVAPNSIDFSTVFSKFDIAGQGAVLGTILVVFVLFVLFLFWGRYMDGQDVLQWGVTMLADNYRQDSYFYLVTVHTGMVRHGGTTSNISFCIAGEEDDTGVRMLSDGVRQEMKSGSTMHFLMAVPEKLGTLQCFRIWHDNSGKGDSASWYLNRIEVTDLQTNDRYDFLCYKWMALEEGILDRAIALSSVENMKNFRTMFFEHARKHLTDDHLWVSVALRPVKSHFSRVQRIGCCYALLMLAMIANAMFFQSKDNKDREQSADFSIGPISFSVSQIYISFISTVITAVPVFFIMLLFRKSKLSTKATKDGARLWMPKCFRGFKFYQQSKAIEKIMVIRDIVDDVDGVLPHFCVYISWIFCFCCVFVSAFFIMLYSMEWGKDISEEWLVTFILSFFESLIIMDPVKVLVLAILFALLLKTIKASKPSEFNLNHIERMVREHGLVGEGRARMDYRSPFSEEELQAAKSRYIRRKTMRKAIQELLTNIFFLIILCSISYSNRDPLGYRLHENISNMFMEPFKPAVTLKHINSSEHYFRWLRETVIPNMFPTHNFNGSYLTPDMRLRISDLQNYRVGAPRLRQVRQAQKSCTIPYVGTTSCYPIYDLATEENRDWCQGWRSRAPCPDYQELAVTNQAWTFVSALKIWGLPITGQLNVYGGGGYIAELDISRTVAEMSYDELFTQRWIDRNTRAVFLEFTLYNVNKNMFCYVSILAEFPESGGVHEFTNVYPFRSYNHLGTVGKYILVCEIVFGIFSLIWLVYIVVRLTKERWSFFKSFWNVVELVSVITSFSAVILYFIRLNYTNEAMALYKENDRVFINFYHIAVWDSLFVYVLGFLVGIATMRLLKVMGYSRVTQIVYLVLKESSKTLPGFFFYIMLILAAYGLLGYIFFGKTSYSYKDPITTMETLFSAVLGHAGFRNTNVPVSDSWITLIYFSSFIMIVVFALSNIFMTILLDTMSMIGDDPKNLNYKEIELFAYMYESAKSIITGQKEQRGLDTTKGGPTLDEKKPEVPFTIGGYNIAGMEAHNRKLQMKLDMAALSGNANKPAYN